MSDNGVALGGSAINSINMARDDIKRMGVRLSDQKKATDEFRLKVESLIADLSARISALEPPKTKRRRAT